jgi:hypothetical protein
MLLQLPARAFERQWHVGGGLGVASFTESDTTIGPALEAYAAYGLSDVFDLRTQLLVSRHTRFDRAFEPLAITGGLVYKVDVLTWIPYFGVEFGYYRFFGESLPDGLSEHEPGISLDLGLDYLLSPSIGLGIELRYHGFLSDSMAGLVDAAFLTGLLRAEYHWGW